MKQEVGVGLLLIRNTFRVQLDGWHHYPSRATCSLLYQNIPTSLTLCAWVSTPAPLALGTGSALPVTGSWHHLPGPLPAGARQVPEK